MRGVQSRMPERGTRVDNEVEKAIRFANTHGGWPLDLSPAACRAVLRRPDGADLQEQWGDVVETILEG